MDSYIELSLEADTQKQELLIAELSELNFDNFSQEENLLMAYSLSKEFTHSKDEALKIIEKYHAKLCSIKTIANDLNWNEKWEENFESTTIGNEIYVRALFHENKEGFKHQIIIQPKMSFGTGHHETTQLMMELMLEEQLSKVGCLDMGCGTGVLSILAEQMGAAHTIAIDYDEWCFENTKENFALNHIQKATVILGDAAVLAESTFMDLWLPLNERIILSNITKNYNLENLGIYHNISPSGTVILLSGFYENDLPDIIMEAEKHGIQFVKMKTKNNWCAAKFVQQ